MIFSEDEIDDDEEKLPLFESIFSDEDEEEVWFVILIWCFAFIYIENDYLDLVLVFIYIWDLLHEIGVSVNLHLVKDIKTS